MEMMLFLSLPVRHWRARERRGGKKRGRVLAGTENTLSPSRATDDRRIDQDWSNKENKVIAWPELFLGKRLRSPSC